MRLLRVLCTVACAVMPVLGTTVTGVFAPPGGSLTASHTYIFSGYSITATAFGPNNPAGGAVQLYGKTAGGDETGAGLTNDPSGDFEITVGSFIQLDLSNLPHDINGQILPGLSITMGSTTSESFRISQSNNSGTLGGCPNCWTGTSNGSVLITPAPFVTGVGAKKYLDITSTGGNVLLVSISFDDGGGGGAQTTPEPLTFALVGGGLIGMYFIRRRRPGPPR
jgi:PEP-CTERM motif